MLSALVNFIEGVVGVERFCDSIDCTDKKKDMAFLVAQMEPHINKSVDLVMVDGACRGLLRKVEKKHPT